MLAAAACARTACTGEEPGTASLATAAGKGGHKPDPAKASWDWQTLLSGQVDLRPNNSLQFADQYLPV